MSWDLIINIAVIGGIIFIGYSKFRKQSLREIWEELIELFKPPQGEIQ